MLRILTAQSGDIISVLYPYLDFKCDIQPNWLIFIQVNKAIITLRNFGYAINRYEMSL